MHVKRYGTGTQHYLCLHGWSGNHRTFEPLAEVRPPNVSLYCPDIPHAQTLSEITDQLTTLAQTLARPLQIVGNCSGALHTLLIAERIPTDRIVMIDAFAYWPAYFRLFLAPGFGRHAYMTAFANPIGRWMTNRSLARHRAKSTNLTEGFTRVDHAATYRSLQQLATIGAADRFKNIHAAIDLAYGARSFKAVRKSAAIWKRIFPQAHEHVLDDAGPLPLLEATRALGNIIFTTT